MTKDSNPDLLALPLLVLAGGFGTRLQSVLSGLPKPLAPVGGRPFLLLQIEQWIGQGVKSFIFLLHHHADLIIEFLKNEQANLLRECQVHYVVEPSPMGTGGAISYAVEQLGIEGDFLVANADTWLGSGIQQLMEAHSPAVLTTYKSDVGRYGEIIFNHQHQILAFTEKKIGDAHSGWINAGLYRMNSSLFRELDFKKFSLEETVFPRLVKINGLLAVPVKAEFIDIGIPEDYSRFCQWVESGKAIEL
ncbi:NTP transferase domain-containing protein [Polynucleobacter paneuropaeus]|nr:NTP transferase domain-containing protein [Polynucleobacter paneuropaeus]